LLAALGVPFEVLAADIDESRDERDPVRLAGQLAREKARAVAAVHPDRAVLGADTVVAIDGRVLGKPRDAEEARSMLRALRGRAHTVVTGVALIAGGYEAVEPVRTIVRMRDYGDAEVDAYFSRGASDDGPYDKAGAYAIQDSTFRPVAETAGCVCSVIGLPLWRIHSMLRSAGIEAGTPTLARCAGCPDAPGGTRQSG
jgi:septum formation protein